MWRKLQECPPYFILTTQKYGYKVFVTDHVTIWFVYFSRKSFIACLQDSNFGLDVDIDEFTEKGYNLLCNPTGLKSLIITKGASSLEVSMTKLFEYPLKIKFNLVEGSKELFFHYVTRLLIKNISDLKSSQEMLRELLKKKDDEIEEYKCEGKEIAIRYLKTNKFNDEEHMNQHQAYKECGELLDIPMTLLDQIVADDVKEENLEMPQINQAKREAQKATISQECVTSSSNNTNMKVECSSNSGSPRKKRKLLLNY